MKNIFILLFSILTLNVFQSTAQVDVSLFDYWMYYSDIENAQYKYFCRIAFEQLDEREMVISNLKSKEDWINRQGLVRNKLEKLIGPFPEKTPLNARVTGIVKREDYRVEKVIYESVPGYYVTAALFIPEKINGRAPAILNAIGHSTQSFRRDIYQHVIINLVKKGFVVLTYDQIGQGERLQYYDEELGKSRLPSTSEHSYPGGQCFISGYSPAKYFIWDGIRGIDYLLTRKEVDPDRIGMTGLSGGGTSTAFTAAIDERIYAAAPTCFITNYKYLFKSRGPQDAEQNLYHFISEGLDHADLIELRAPKPTLIVSTTRDFFSIQGARETFREAKNAYRALGGNDQLQMTEGDNDHGFVKNNNEATYAFFQKYLNNPGDSVDEDVETIPEIDLQVTETGQLATSLKGETIYSLNKKQIEKQVVKLESSRIDIDKHIYKVTDAAKKISGLDYPQQFGEVIFSGRTVTEEYNLEKYLISGSGEYMIPLALFTPKNKIKNETILLLHERGKEYAINNDSLAKQLLKNGYAVLLGDLPGIGEMGPGYLKGDAYIDKVSYNQWFAGILTGKSIVGLRAEDIIRMIHFIKTNLPDSQPVSAISVGVLGSELLHAAAFEKDIQKIGLIQPFLSFGEIALTREYKPSFIPSTVSGAIEEYDLPDLMSSLCPRKMIIINPLSGNGLKTENAQAKNSILFPTKVYLAKGVPGNFDLISQGEEQTILESLLSWLR
ncbi:acetylxylan esterase [Draconibacterium sp.]|nr:acetylxylan esterase [Draconibacterium sp.]